MGTGQNRLIMAILTSTHNLCFEAKTIKNVSPCTTQFYYPTKIEGEGLRALKEILKPPGSLLATDRSKAVVLV